MLHHLDRAMIGNRVPIHTDNCTIESSDATLRTQFPTCLHIVARSLLHGLQGNASKNYAIDCLPTSTVARYLCRLVLLQRTHHLTKHSRISQMHPLRETFSGHTPGMQALRAQGAKLFKQSMNIHSLVMR